MAALKCILLLSLFALAFGLPTAQELLARDDSVQLISATSHEGFSEVEDYLDQLLEQDNNIPVDQVADDGFLSRQKRACRSVRIRTRSGRVITVRRC